MILLMFGLMIFGIWYLADKKLGKNFNSILKYCTLALAVFFVLFDVNLYMETNQYIYTQQFAPNGFDYNDPVTGQTTTLYGASTEDSGTVMAYHYTEFAFWPVLNTLLPFVFLTVAGFLIMQIVGLMYDEYRGKIGESK